MKSLILDRPGRFTVRDCGGGCPDPNAGEALVRVHRVGVCATDLHAFKGEQPFFTYPRILGHELGVEVVRIGENSFGLEVGDFCAVEPYLECGRCIACRRGKGNCCTGLRVLGVHTDGGMRELLTVPANKLHRSRTLSVDQLAVVEPLCIGAHAVSRSVPEPGETVLVIGSGPIGLSVIAFAVSAGARVLVTDVNPTRLEFARTHFAIAAAIPADDGAVGIVQELTAGDMPTLVVDATGNRQSMNAAFDLVAHGGRLVFAGLVQGDITFNDADAHRRELTLLCSRNAAAADFRRVIGLIESGAIDIRSWITDRVPLGDEVVHAFPRWSDRLSGFIKALIEIT